ncbi:MAG: DUF3891 family protein [Beijerinckiaceae bacterium]
MLLRKESPGVIAIPQINHAWVSGQLARAWGNEKFAAPTPRELVCLAAEQHDIGWLDYDLKPDFDFETGLPQEFRQAPDSVHTALWRDGVTHARVYGRYVALLVSLHADTLYQRHFDLESANMETAALVRRFLDDQRAYQAEMLISLAEDPVYGKLATREAVEHNRLLIAALDGMSLSICWGVAEPVPVGAVPVRAAETTDIVLRQGNSASDIVVDPWPFAVPQVEIQAEGRRLHGPYADDAVLYEAFEAAEPAVICAVLRPA